MQREIDNAFGECINNLQEYLDDFDERYRRFQRDLFSYKREKHNVVNVVDYSNIYCLRTEINRKIESLRQKIRNILEEI